MRQTSQYRNNWTKLLQAIWLSKSFQYLGLTLDETLRFNEHVECLGKSQITNKWARELYHAFIYSRIKYGLEVYGNCPAKKINTIQVTQNKLLKLILHKDRIIPIDGIHKMMNILKVKDIYECNVLSFVKNIWMKMCPRSFELYFQKGHNNYDVRRKKQLVVHLVRLCLGKKAVWVTGASLLKCFKGKLKNHYISKYMCDVLICDLVVLWFSKPTLWNMIAYCIVPTWKTIVSIIMFDPCCPSYFSIFCLVVSKMSFALPWQPTMDCITCDMLS